MTRYTFSIDLPADVPEDVVSEFVGQALKKFLRDRTSVKVLREPAATVGGTLSGPTQPLVRRGRAHPFDGPEVFDDDMSIATFEQLVHGEVPHESITDAYPHLSELLKQRRELTQAPGEGDWQLSDEDRVGEDL